jgi:hypothetical protein
MAVKACPGRFSLPRMVFVLCLRCEDLAKAYVANLDEYVDLMESRSFVGRVWPDLQARILTAEGGLQERLELAIGAS